MRLETRTVAVLIAALGVTGPGAHATPHAAAAAAHRLERTVTVPAGTVLRVAVTRGFGSDISRVEDPVSATLVRDLYVNGERVVPSGSRLGGYVSQAVRSGRVKGRARVAVRFTELVVAERGDRYTMRTRPWVAVARATKKKDALTIGIPAAGGTVVGGLLGGKKGAGIGALTGGGAGTAVVLTARGREVRVGRGATMLIRLAAPLTMALR